MKVASVGFLALLALAAVTDAMVFEDDSVDPTEESSLYDHQGSFKRDVPRHPVAHMKEKGAQQHAPAVQAIRRHHHRHEVEKHPHHTTKSTKAHAKAPRKFAATKPPATPRHHVSKEEMEMEEEMEEQDEKEDTMREEEADYAPVEDEDDDDLHEKGQAMVESFDDDSIEDELDESDEDDDDKTSGIAGMASAAASGKQHEWTPKPVKVKQLKSDKHTTSVLATIRAMRTKPRLLATKKFAAPTVIHALAPTKKAKPHKKSQNFKYADDSTDDEPASFGKVKAKGFLADRSWMLGAGKSYGGYRKTGGAARRYNRAKGEITDFAQSDNAESSAASEYSYDNVKRVAAGKLPTVFAQELHDGASRLGAILKPKFRSMRGRFRGRGTGEEAVNRQNKKAQIEIKALFALGKK